MINYLFSGIDRIKGFTKEQAKYLQQDIKNEPKIAFIASIPNNYEKKQGTVITIHINI